MFFWCLATAVAKPKRSTSIGLRSEGMAGTVFRRGCAEEGVPSVPEEEDMKAPARPGKTTFFSGGNGVDAVRHPRFFSGHPRSCWEGSLLARNCRRPDFFSRADLLIRQVAKMSHENKVAAVQFAVGSLCV